MLIVGKSQRWHPPANCANGLLQQLQLAKPISPQSYACPLTLERTNLGWVHRQKLEARALSSFSIQTAESSSQPSIQSHQHPILWQATPSPSSLSTTLKRGLIGDLLAMFGGQSPYQLPERGTISAKNFPNVVGDLPYVHLPALQCVHSLYEAMILHGSLTGWPHLNDHW